TWSPQLQWFSFRYALVIGVPGQLALGAVRALEVRSDVASTGMFNSSNAVYNNIAAMAVATVRQSIHGFPEDNPSRERRGWYADAHLVSDLSLDSLDMDPIYANFIEDMVGGQMPNAYQPDAPKGMVFDHAQAVQSAQYFFSDPAWAVAVALIPLADYQRSGDP